MVSLAIIDIIGLTYDGDTLTKKGLGGSESAVILLSKELVKCGFDVTVFNNTIDKDSKEGVYDGVKFYDLRALHQPNDFKFDVVISSRTVMTFLNQKYWGQFTYPAQVFQQIKANAKLKAIWLHDTFCSGDYLLEEMLVTGEVDEIFTLSDFQTSYVSQCDHGGKRNFEVLKNKIFMTRNGALQHTPDADITKKDRNLFVYNASVTKGMIPLVERIWPKVKEKIPSARLKIIGGFYRFRDELGPDEQENKFWQLHDRPENTPLSIEFTGIIKQSEIAEILNEASFMIFPGAFPETFGISALESLLHNTPLITTRFGALEETAVDQACYMIDYAIEPNSLFPRINREEQEQRFVDMVVRAWNDTYLHQQKMYYCNIVKPVAGWDSVALQWKQHIYKKLGLYLPLEDYKKVSTINSRVHKIYGRRFSNPEELYIPRNTQQKITIITPTYNASNYIEKCIQSVITQDYDNYEMIIIDDASTDNTYDIALNYASDKVKVFKNTENRGAVYNQVMAIAEFSSSDDIVMLLDGDDSLVNDNQIFHMFNNLYDGSTEFTYGSCWSMVDNIPLVSQPYPESVKQSKTYRQHKFNWNMPYTHLRTFKAGLLNDVDESNFKDDQGNWFKAGGDGSLFYTLIEKADPNKVKVIQDIIYNYNDTNPLNDYKVNAAEQTKNAEMILKR